MKTTITLLAICLVYGLCGQVQDFDYPTFKTPDTEFKLLRISPLASFSRSSNLNSTALRDFTARIDIDYFNQVLTRKKNSNFGLFTDLRYESSEGDNNDFTATIRANDALQFYFKPLRFFEFEYEAFASYTRSNEDGITESNNRQSVLIAPKIGFGRIENVRNAWHTESILKTLEGEGLLKKTPTKEEMYLLAEEIVRIKNQRVIDFRYDDIYEFETVINYLVENGFVDPTDYKFFSIFQDVWRFEAFTTRRHGSNLKLGLKTELTRSNFSPSSFSSNSESYGITGEYEKAISKKEWQFVYQIRSSYGRIFVSNNDSRSNFDASASYLIGYYPSSRINAEFDVGANYLNLASNDNLLLNAGLDINYFVSPQVTYSLWTGWSDNIVTSFGTGFNRFNISLAVRYDVF